MPIFVYEAKDGPHKKIRGKIEAKTQDAAVEKLYELGRVPIKISQRKERKESAPKPVVFKKYVRTPKARDITIFTQQLASLLKSGVPIIRSISIISEQSESSELRVILKKVSKDIKEGATLTDALKKYNNVFTKLYISMVNAGESGGKIYEALGKVAVYRRKAEESASKVRTAMVYPLLMGAVGVGTIVFMLVFVMPRITRLFVGLGQALPFPTRVVMWVSSGLLDNWFNVLLGVTILTVIFRQFSRTEIKRNIASFLSLHIPVVKKFTRMVEFARFSRTMELMIKSGIPILTALRLSAPTVQNGIIRTQILKCCDDLEQGGSFGAGLQASGIFPPFMVNLIIVAEETGRFDEVFEEIADTYERESDAVLKALMSLLEPVMILVMGLVVGFVVIAMLLPIFEINFAVG